VSLYDEVLATLGAKQRDAILAFLASTECDGDSCSHGKLELPTLVRMLLQDVALMVHRPGSWEGNNMAQVMASHGYTEHADHEPCHAARLAYWNGRDPYAPAVR